MSMTLLSFYAKPYFQFLTDFVQSTSTELQNVSPFNEDENAGVVAVAPATGGESHSKKLLNKFDKLALDAKKAHFDKVMRNSSFEDDCVDKNSESAPGLRKRRKSATDTEMVEFHLGFCAEVDSLDTGGYSWFQSERELRHVGGSSSRLHSHVDSLFSSASGFNNFRGLLNLGIILLVVSNARVALENLIKYGILVDPVAIVNGFLDQMDHLYPCAMLLLLCNIFAWVSLGTEYLAEMGRVPLGLIHLLQFTNLTAVLALPAAIILQIHPNPFFSAPTLGIFSVVFLKLWSYRDVNSWCRYERFISQNKHFERKRNKSIASAMNEMNQKTTNPGAPLVRYPDNLTLFNLYFFLFAPTICYELNFPRILRIRKRFLLKRVLELIFLPQVMAALAQQWIVPILRNSLKPLKESEWPVVLERLMKLAIPNHLIWLIFFYVFFHSALNVFGELIRFGDRTFYKDWWNSEQVTVFWSTWNIPIHRFAKRHLFLPLTIRWKLSKFQASCVVFFVSAFFHEYLVSIPLNMFRLWAFFGMMSQIPLAMFVNRVLKGGQLGNMAVWLSLIIGQPLALMMYFHDYYVQLQTPISEH